MNQMSKKASHCLPNLLHSRWKHILLFLRKVEVETIKQISWVPEAVLEAQQTGMFMIIFSLMMHSCGMCYGMIQGRSLLGILRSGDGGMME
jgi:hypothetical protein